MLYARAPRRWLSWHREIPASLSGQIPSARPVFLLHPLNTPEKQVEKCVSPLFYAGSINYEQEYLHFHMGNTGLEFILVSFYTSAAIRSHMLKLLNSITIGRENYE
jgi:hypothetical protein